MAIKAKIKAQKSRKVTLSSTEYRSSSSGIGVDVSLDPKIVRVAPTALKVLRVRDDTISELNRTLRNENSGSKFRTSYVKYLESE